MAFPTQARGTPTSGKSFLFSRSVATSGISVGTSLELIGRSGSTLGRKPALPRNADARQRLNTADRAQSKRRGGRIR